MAQAGDGSGKVAARAVRRADGVPFSHVVVHERLRSAGGLRIRSWSCGSVVGADGLGPAGLRRRRRKRQDVVRHMGGAGVLALQEVRSVESEAAQIRHHLPGHVVWASSNPHGRRDVLCS